MLFDVPSPSPTPFNVNVTNIPPDTALENYTLALAIFTAILAMFTVGLAVIGAIALLLQRREIQHTAAGIALTRDAQAASVQPLLTSVPLQKYLSGNELHNVTFAEGLVERLHDLGDILVPRYPGQDGAFCSVPLRNVGSGVAFLKSNSISDGRGRTGWNGRVSNAVVPAGELTRITYSVPLDRAELNDLRRGLFAGQPPPEVDVGYTDLGGRTFGTKLFLRWTGAIWYVRQVYLYRDDEPEPVATTGPSDP